jgi:hypothetical protein
MEVSGLEIEADERGGSGNSVEKSKVARRKV